MKGKDKQTVVELEKTVHRDLSILCACKGVSMKGEASAALTKHINRESARLERNAEKKGAA